MRRRQRWSERTVSLFIYFRLTAKRKSIMMAWARAQEFFHLFQSAGPWEIYMASSMHDVMTAFASWVSSAFPVAACA